MLTKDPVCGMTVDDRVALSVEHEGRRVYFCSALCQAAFSRQPARYAAARAGEPEPGAEPRIAYFSMEIAVDPRIPTYSGGLGVLAGDTLRACADLRVPVVGVTLLYRKGYFRQRLDARGNQEELPVAWEPGQHLRLLPRTVEVSIAGRRVHVAAWQLEIMGATGFKVPVLFLDLDVEGNSAEDRRLTDCLYGGDERCRLSQEIVLGIGGVRMLRAQGWDNKLARYHMNEGHSALLALELLRETMAGAPGAPADFDFDKVRRCCVFTTHTPVPAGHDCFDYALAEHLLNDTFDMGLMRMLGGEQSLNMTLLALNASHYINGVAKRHGEVSRNMFPLHTVESITNGVHSHTWTCDSLRALFDRHIPGWRSDSFALRYVLGIGKDEIWAAHVLAKQKLIAEVNRISNVGMDTEILTIGFGRRATLYKRADLLFADLARLRRLAKEQGPLQVVFAGKAHPRDQQGKELIRKVMAAAKELGRDVPVAYLPNYEMETARLLVSGVDLWLNTPRKPMEASGTSGMKAAHNGVPSLSVLDGWWLEGHIEGVTGWSIGSREPHSGRDLDEVGELYDKLERVIMPLYYRDRDNWLEIMRHTIALNGSFFNTHRMIQQYVLNAYL